MYRGEYFRDGKWSNAYLHAVTIHTVLNARPYECILYCAWIQFLIKLRISRFKIVIRGLNVAYHFVFVIQKEEEKNIRK